MINDIEIKKQIKIYQNSKINFDKIKEMISQFIYHFPSISFEVYDDDIKGDFYLYIMDRLEKIIESYQVQENSQFKTFFYLVLKRHYLNFQKSRKKDFIPIQLNENIKDDKNDLIDKTINLEKMSLIFISLPHKYQLILKLRCPDFLLPEDIIAIGKEFKKDPVELLKKINIIYENSKNKETKRIQTLQKSKKELKKVNLQNYPITSPRVIADFLDKKPNEISKWLVDIRNIVKEKVGDIYVS